MGDADTPVLTCFQTRAARGFNLLTGRRPSSADRGRGGRPGHRDWLACSAQARDSRNRCIR